MLTSEPGPNDSYPAPDNAHGAPIEEQAQAAAPLPILEALRDGLAAEGMDPDSLRSAPLSGALTGLHDFSRDYLKQTAPQARLIPHGLLQVKIRDYSRHVTAAPKQRQQLADHWYYRTLRYADLFPQVSLYDQLAGQLRQEQDDVLADRTNDMLVIAGIAIAGLPRLALPVRRLPYGF